MEQFRCIYNQQEKTVACEPFLRTFLQAKPPYGPMTEVTGLVDSRHGREAVQSVTPNNEYNITPELTSCWSTAGRTAPVGDKWIHPA